MITVQFIVKTINTDRIETHTHTIAEVDYVYEENAKNFVEKMTTIIRVILTLIK